KHISSFLQKQNHDHLSHHEIVEVLFQSFKGNPAFATLDENFLKARIWILYKYVWYHNQTSEEETSLDRFIKWHLKDIQSSYKEANKEKQLTILEKRLVTILPLTPYSRKKLEKFAQSA